MTGFLRMALLTGGMMAMAGCAGDLADMPSPTAQFVNNPYYVNVASVQVESKYNPAGNPTDISSTLPVTPAAALKTYAETRLKPAGGQGALHFIIDDAEVFEEGLKSQSSVGRWLDVDNHNRYTAVLKVHLVRDPSSYGAPGAMEAQIRAERTATLPDGISLDERDRKLEEFLGVMLGDVDKAVTDNILNTLKLSAPAPGELAPSPGAWPAPAVPEKGTAPASDDHDVIGVTRLR